MPIINGKQTDLAAYSAQFRVVEISRNKYSVNNQYVETSKDALSDGDVNGKGELNGSIGSSSDIAERNREIARNIYSPNNQYDSSKVSA